MSAVAIAGIVLACVLWLLTLQPRAPEPAPAQHDDGIPPAVCALLFMLAVANAVHARHKRQRALEDSD